MDIQIGGLIVNISCLVILYSEEVSTDIEDLQRIRNKASTDVSNASTDNIHQRMSASTDKDFN